MQNIATIYNGQALGPDEIQQMQVIHQEKVAARNEKAKLEKVGSSVKAGGVATNMAGKGVKAAGKGMQTGGKVMMKAGAELSATSLAGGGARVAGSAMDTGEKGMSRAGKGLKNIGKSLNVVSRLKQAKKKTGFEGAVKNKIEKKVEDVVKKKILCGIPVVSTFYGSYVFFINITTVSKKKKISLDLWNWLLLIISNIEMIVFTLVGLAIVTMIIDFREASIFDQLKMIYKGFTTISWSGIKALIELF